MSEPTQPNEAAGGRSDSTAVLGAWLPIETAPTEPFNEKRWFAAHSPRILLWMGAFCEIGTYDYTQKGKGRWLVYGRVVCPKYWMPLPEAPNNQGKGLAATDSKQGEKA